MQKDDMKIEKIIQLLNNKSTTVTDVINFFQLSIEEFQEKSINIKAQELREQYSNIDVKTLDLNEQANIMFDLIQKETALFLQDQYTTITDTILDLINERKVNKHAAFNFITILSTIKELLDEQQAAKSSIKF